MIDCAMIAADLVVHRVNIAMSQQSVSGDVGQRLEMILRRHSATYLTLAFSQLSLNILYVTTCWLAHHMVATLLARTIFTQDIFIVPDNFDVWIIY